MRGPDFIVENHGSIMLLRAESPAAKEWQDEHLDLEEAQRLCGAVVVEPRYIGDIAAGIMADGLTIKGE